MQEKLKIVAYIRDSLGRREVMDLQKNKIIEFANEQYNVEEKDITFFEDGKSVLEKRISFDNMIDEIKNKKYNLLLLTHIDRLYKTNYENGVKILNEIVDTMKDSGIYIVSIDEKRSI